MNLVLKTLFYPLEKHILEAPASDAKILFLNAQYHPALDTLPNLTPYQIFKPYAAELEARRFNVQTEISPKQPKDTGFDAAFILLPKNRIEALALIAHGLNAIKENGLLLCAADNKAGGSRLKKMLAEFGIENADDISKNKCRAAWAYKETINKDAISAAIQSGAFQKTLNDDYMSQPGIFGWDKIDKGSALLAASIPTDLKGHGADFGCGYGYLARHALENCPAVKSLLCVDADHRAINATRENLTSEKAQYLWADLTKPIEKLPGLDFIIMNPPFHEGKKSDSDIGAAFIKTAHAALKKKAALYMVANNQLPYEDILKNNFWEFEKITQANGFKILRAVK